MRISYRQLLPRTFAVLVVMALAAPAVVSAQTIGSASDPAQAQYGDVSSQIATGSAGGGSPSPTPSTEVIGGLPFTGSDLLVLGGAVVALVGVGFGLGRQARIDG
jgi:hypothetical protein